MEAAKATIRHFTDLHAWKSAKALVIFVYTSTQAFPVSEQFGLTNQMRRAAVSVAANIAEGFARRTGKDKRGFYQTALASLAELESHFLIARELNFIDQKSLDELRGAISQSGKLLTGLIRSALDRT